ncbi:hypothetical protein [Moorena sp. SIO3H5]|uniref:hypothetical protein n=1 Tax=Moorena sp. SIO3H5 TaxID=2607834 RepID=UPI0013BBB1C7|nr:hypothetical protein [Moorena sp. SIO3H5]NEO69921.1 hypothetical protein [Moorena sp. SIO3H5]
MLDNEAIGNRESGIGNRESGIAMHRFYHTCCIKTAEVQRIFPFSLLLPTPFAFGRRPGYGKAQRRLC